MMITADLEINFRDQNMVDFSASATVSIRRKCSIYKFRSLDMTDLPFGGNPLDKNKIILFRPVRF